MDGHFICAIDFLIFFLMSNDTKKIIRIFFRIERYRNVSSSYIFFNQFFILNLVFFTVDLGTFQNAKFSTILLRFLSKIIDTVIYSIAHF